MSTFRDAVFLAALVGLLAGLAMAAVQSFTTIPLIRQAEILENAVPAHEHAAGAPAHGHEGHEDQGWTPTDGAERTLYTIGANIVTAFGFALLLVVASELAGGITSLRQGVLWGLAGFAVFTLAPGLGLPPELPAMPAADLGARQAWWWMAVIGAAAGLALIVFRGTLLWSLVGLALVITPHLVGAPQPVSYETLVPEGLHRSFVVMSTVTSLVFWVLLGALVDLLRSRFKVGEGRFV